MLWLGPRLPGTSIRWSQASTGPKQLQRTALEAFWPEEVTEKWVGASKGPGNSRKRQMLLTLRVSQRAFLQWPLVRARLQSRGLPTLPHGACSPFQEILVKKGWSP